MLDILAVAQDNVCHLDWHSHHRSEVMQMMARFFEIPLGMWRWSLFGAMYKQSFKNWYPHGIDQPHHL